MKRSTVELDREYPHLQVAFDKAREAVINAASAHVDAPSEARLEALRVAVDQYDQADANLLDWHKEMGAALRAERLATFASSDRKDTP